MAYTVQAFASPGFKGQFKQVEKKRFELFYLGVICAFAVQILWLMGKRSADRVK
jgi:hypothetical protein